MTHDDNIYGRKGSNASNELSFLLSLNHACVVGFRVNKLKARGDKPFVNATMRLRKYSCGEARHISRT
jgi:hypothetical protein